jgi:hypothetical protein
MHPTRLLFVIAEENLPPLESARELSLTDGMELLAAPALILVPFEAWEEEPRRAVKP